MPTKLITNVLLMFSIFILVEKILLLGGSIWMVMLKIHLVTGWNGPQTLRIFRKLWVWVSVLVKVKLLLLLKEWMKKSRQWVLEESEFYLLVGIVDINLSKNMDLLHHMLRALEVFLWVKFINPQSKWIQLQQVGFRH